MPRPKAPLLTERESEIMTVLWELGSASAEDIRGKLTGNPHDSTVRTLLRVLVSKGYVVANRETRPTTYRAVVRQRTMRKKMTRELLKRFFAGSAEDLVLQLLDDDRLSPEELERIRAMHQRRSTEETRQ